MSVYLFVLALSLHFCTLLSFLWTLSPSQKKTLRMAAHWIKTCGCFVFACPLAVALHERTIFKHNLQIIMCCLQEYVIVCVFLIALHPHVHSPQGEVRCRGAGEAGKGKRRDHIDTRGVIDAGSTLCVRPPSSLGSQTHNTIHIVLLGYPPLSSHLLSSPSHLLCVSLLDSHPSSFSPSLISPTTTTSSSSPSRSPVFSFFTSSLPPSAPRFLCTSNPLHRPSFSPTFSCVVPRFLCFCP